MRKAESLLKAEAVLALASVHDDWSSIDAFIDCYQNGREQGFQIWGRPKKGIGWDSESYIGLFFAEHRNSDEIVVYEGPYSMQSLGSEKTYRNGANCFETVEEAAKYVYERCKVLFEKLNG